MQRKRSPRGKQFAVQSRALVRDEEACRLRAAGASYREIDQQLKYGGEANACRAVRRRTDQVRTRCAEAAEQVRHLELVRLDKMLAGLWAKAAAGDTAAVAAVLRIQERRSAYEGLDMPRALKVEVARELDLNLEKLKAGLSSDVYEQVLGVLAGEHGAAEVGADSNGSPEEDDRDAVEPG